MAESQRISVAEPSAAGFVYILKNEAMPGYIKIGLSQQNDVQTRLKQLDNTSMPLPFECVYAARVPDCRALERTLHFVFGDKRTRSNREFFQADPLAVEAVIKLVELKEETPTDAEQLITPAERQEIEAVKTARPNRCPSSGWACRSGRC